MLPISVFADFDLIVRWPSISADLAGRQLV